MIPRDAKGGENTKENVCQNAVIFRFILNLPIYVFRVGTFPHGIYRQAAVIFGRELVKTYHYRSSRKRNSYSEAKSRGMRHGLQAARLQ
jgi:hypothetical protein